MGVRVVFLQECLLVLSLLKYRRVGAFLNKKIRNPNRGSLLNSSIDTYITMYTNLLNESIQNFHYFFKKAIYAFFSRLLKNSN